MIPASMVAQDSTEDPEQTNDCAGSNMAGILSHDRVAMASHIVAFSNRTLPVLLTWMMV